MATNRSPNDLRGFLIPWNFASANLWNAESTYTQQGPSAGVPSAAGSYDLIVSAAGSQADDTEVKIYTQQAGNVGESKFIWKYGTDTLYYGRNGANVISYFEIIEASTSSTTTRDISDCLGLSNGRVIALSRNRIVGTNYKAVVYTRSDTGAYTSVDLYTQDNNKPLHGGLCELPDGNILAAHIVSNTTDNTAQLMVHRSADNGSTWNTISNQALPETIDIAGSFGAGNSGFDVSRVRLAYAQGQILLCVGLRNHNTSLSNGDVIAQYASTDNGGSFVHVATSDGGVGFFSFDVLVVNQVFYLTYIKTNDEAMILPLSHAFVGIDTVYGFGNETNLYTGGITISTLGADKYRTAGQLSTWIDEDNRLYFSLEDISNGRMFAGYSDDITDPLKYYMLGNAGRTFTDTTKANWYTIGSANTMITAHCGCSAAGRQVVYHNFKIQGATTTYSASLAAAYLGGWDSVTMPKIVGYPLDYQYAGFSFTWLPYDLPNDTGHYSQTGAGTATLGAGKATISCTSTQEKYYESPAMGSGDPVIIRARCKPISGGTLNGGRGIEFRSGIYWGAVYIDTGSIALYDIHASAQIGSAYNYSIASVIDILFAMDDANVFLWAMVESKTEKQWVLVASGSLSSGSGIASSRVRFGVISSLVFGGTLDTEWYEFHYSSGTATGDGLHGGQSNPADLKSRLYPPVSQFAYIGGGMKITTAEGPAYRGDNYTIATAYDYPVDRVFYANSPSPRNKWRSASVTSGNVPEQKIALFMDTAIAQNDESSFGSDLIGIHLNRINFRSFQIHRYDKASTSWVSLGSFTNQVVAHSFQRAGASIQSTNANGPYIQFDEARDWYVMLVSGETTVVRKLRTNSEGVLSGTSTSKKCILQIAEPVHSDPTSGTMYLIPNSCTAIIDLQGETGAAIRVTVAAQKTAENYAMIGNISIGSIVVPAYQYSRGRSISYESGVESEIQADGTQRISDKQAGGRTYRIAWSEGVDISALFEELADVDYYTATSSGSSNPIAAIGSAPTAMSGVIKYLSGPKTPLVYIPKITRMTAPNTSILLNRRMEFCLCTLEGDVSIENVLGDELLGQNGEVMRVGTIVLRECR